MLEIMHTYDEHGDNVQGIGKIPEAARERLHLAADRVSCLMGELSCRCLRGPEWNFLFGDTLKPQPLGGAPAERPREKGSGRDPQRRVTVFVRGLR